MARLTDKQREAILADGTSYQGARWSLVLANRSAIDIDDAIVMHALRTQALIEGLSEEQIRHLTKCPSLMDMPCNRFANPDSVKSIAAHQTLMRILATILEADRA